MRIATVYNGSLGTRDLQNVQICNYERNKITACSKVLDVKMCANPLNYPFKGLKYFTERKKFIK